MNKEERKIYLREWRSKNKDKCKEYSKKEREKRKEIIAEKKKAPEAREKMLNAVKNWRLKNREHFLQQQKEYKEKNRFKINARFRVTNAIRRGKMIRGTTCEKCGIEGKMESHHENYNEPLKVKWLCRICHNKVHNKLKNL